MPALTLGLQLLQMDIKVTGITEEIMRDALKDAHSARKHILSEMEKVVKKPRDGTKSNAQRL